MPAPFRIAVFQDNQIIFSHRQHRRAFRRRTVDVKLIVLYIGIDDDNAHFFLRLGKVIDRFLACLHHNGILSGLNIRAGHRYGVVSLCCGKLHPLCKRNSLCLIQLDFAVFHCIRVFHHDIPVVCLYLNRPDRVPHQLQQKLVAGC